MKTLNANQVELGNVFVGLNYRGEEVVRRLVGGTYGTVTKYFLIDESGNLKSRKRDTVEEVLEGFKIRTITADEGDKIRGEEKTIEEAKVGDFFIAVSENGSIVKRQLVGGHAYGVDIYFSIDENGKRCSRTRETVQDVLNNYEEVVLVLG